MATNKPWWSFTSAFCRVCFAGAWRTPEIFLQPQNCHLYGANLWFWKLSALADLLRLCHILQSQILLFTAAFQACHQWAYNFSPFPHKHWLQVFQAQNGSPHSSATCWSCLPEFSPILSYIHIKKLQFSLGRRSSSSSVNWVAFSLFFTKISRVMSVTCSWSSPSLRFLLFRPLCLGRIVQVEILLSIGWDYCQVPYI